MKNTLSVLALCAAPLLAQAQAQHCSSPNTDAEYILGTAEGEDSAMHWPTGLVWKRCLEGETFSGGACSTGGATSKAWHDWAATYLPQAFHGQTNRGISAGYSQNLLASGAWRMAYQKELTSITQSCNNDPKINRTVFPDTPSLYVWSGSPYAGNSGGAWRVGFEYGNAFNGGRASSYHVRLVRAGQPFASLSPSTATQNAAAGATNVVFDDIITLGSDADTTAWGGVRIDGGARLRVNSDTWVTEAIVTTGDTIAVRMDAPTSGSRTATLTVRSGQTTGTNADGANGGNESTAVRTTTATFTLNAIENGTCGSAHNPGILLTSAPTANLCNAGAASPAAGGDEKWSWTCAGSFGGFHATCEAPRGYIVTPSASGKGSIGPGMLQVVAGNTRASFDVLPQPGHGAAMGGTCGGSLAGGTYTTAPILGDCTVQARFEPFSYPIAASASPAGAGRVVCTPDPVLHGGSATCKALSNAYRLAEWAGDCAGQSGPVCTLNNVTAAPAVTARFDTGAPIAGPLNDSGLTACDAAGPAAQDCHHGRDAGAATGQLAKQGASADARNGFDYTKISNTGAELLASAALGPQPGDWACTRDNLTGLVWEVKTAAGLRGQNWIYTWHDPHSPDGDGGQQALWDECETEGRCDTAKFVEDVNAAGLCGAHDWRLPTVQELESLVDMGRAAPGPTIDPVYFPDMDPQTLPLMMFWSSTPYAGGGGSSRTWFVDFDPQGCGVCPLERAWSTSVRLVRTGR